MQDKQWASELMTLFLGHFTGFWALQCSATDMYDFLEILGGFPGASSVDSRNTLLHQTFDKAGLTRLLRRAEKEVKPVAHLQDSGNVPAHQFTDKNPVAFHSYS